MESGSTPARNPGIDVLRGMAIVLVVLSHLGLKFRMPLARTPLGALLPGSVIEALTQHGQEAVFIFFVISGFLITTHSLRRWQSLECISLRGFYARRFARIVPLLTVLLVVLAALDLLGVSGYVIHRPGQSLSGAVWSAVTLRLNWYEGQTGYLPANWDVLWSLSIEEAFYLGFPFVCLLTRRRSVLVTLLVVLALSLPVTRDALTNNSIWMEKAYLPGMSAIAIGVLGALIGAGWHGPPRWLVAAMAALGTAGIAAMLGADIPLYRIFGSGGELLVLSASSLLLILAFHWDNLRVPNRSFRSFGWLRFFGRNSYEVYLTHMFVVLTAVALFQALGSPWRFADLWYMVTLGLCALLGAIVARYLSAPSDRALRRLLLGARHPQLAERSLSLE